MYGEARLKKMIAEEKKKVEAAFNSKPFHEKLLEAKQPNLAKNLDNIKARFWKACRESKVLHSNLKSMLNGLGEDEQYEVVRSLNMTFSKVDFIITCLCYKLFKQNSSVAVFV